MYSVDVQRVKDILMEFDKFINPNSVEAAVLHNVNLSKYYYRTINRELPNQ